MALCPIQQSCKEACVFCFAYKAYSIGPFVFNMIGRA